jgi:uncharacterized membrane protein YGL010W
MMDGRWGSVTSVYDAAHRRRGTRIAHLIALPLMASSAVVMLVSLRWAVAVLAVGWTVQLLSHTFIERNDQCLRNWKQALLAGTWAVAEWRAIFRRISGRFLRRRNGR